MTACWEQARLFLWIQILFRLGGGVDPGSGPDAPKLSARKVSASSTTSFTALTELPFGSGGPGEPPAVLEIDAL